LQQQGPEEIGDRNLFGGGHRRDALEDPLSARGEPEGGEASTTGRPAERRITLRTQRRGDSARDMGGSPTGGKRVGSPPGTSVYGEFRLTGKNFRSSDRYQFRSPSPSSASARAPVCRIRSDRFPPTRQWPRPGGGGGSLRLSETHQFAVAELPLAHEGHPHFDRLRVDRAVCIGITRAPLGDGTRPCFAVAPERLVRTRSLCVPA